MSAHQLQKSACFAKRLMCLWLQEGDRPSDLAKLAGYDDNEAVLRKQNPQHVQKSLCGLWCSFHFKRTLGLMVMVSQRFPRLFPVLPYILAAKEHSPLRKQTMDIFHRPHRVHMSMPQTISNIQCALAIIWQCSKFQDYPLVTQTNCQEGMNEEKRDKLLTNFQESRHKIINTTTWHLSISYSEQRLQWVQRNAV